MVKNIVVLGAGISGLAAAWYLKEELGESASIKVIEKESRAGGWVKTLVSEDYLFEQGPRSFRSRGAAKETLALIEALGLHNEIMTPHPDASRRYIYRGGRLQSLPKHFWEVPFNALTRGWMGAVLRDLTNPKRKAEDESIRSFFTRRFGSRITEQLIDPFVVGIYAGDLNQLSMKSCFPQFDEREQMHGSLLKAAWCNPTRAEKESAFVQSMKRIPLFTFKEGMETLPRALAEALKECLILGNGAVRLDLKSEGIGIALENGERMEADVVLSTLPSYALGSLLGEHDEVRESLVALDYASVALVNLAYQTQVNPYKGFGYLVPHDPKELVLGCIWDSCVFPQQNIRKDQTRLTVMMGGGCHPEIEELGNEEIMKQALSALHRHFGISADPSFVHISKTIKAIPQFPVGHALWKERVERRVSSFSNRLILSGTAWSGVSLNDCIRNARQAAQTIIRKAAS